MATMAEVASERGYAATRVSDVLEHTGISRRTFYVYFANRDDCFLAAYDAIVADVERLLATPDSAAERSLAPIVDRVLGYFARWPAHGRVFLIEILSAGPGDPRRHEQSMTMLATRFVACAHWQPGDCASLERAVAAQALVGAMARIVQRQLLLGGARALPSLAPSLLTLGTRVALAA
jgi:AcrR family transcriptional regulator